MGTHLSAIDYVVFGLYVLLIVGIGLWISRTKKGAFYYQFDQNLYKMHHETGTLFEI